MSASDMRLPLYHRQSTAMSTSTITTLGEARGQAEERLRAGDYAAALRVYDHLMAVVPLDYGVRLRVADLLARVGLVEEAAEVYRTVAVHDIRSGRPLPAVVACAALDQLGRPADDLREMLADGYAAGSPQLARFAVRQAPVAPGTMVPPLPEGAEPFDELAERARRRALDLSSFAPYQPQVHPVPFLSELAREPFLALLRSIEVLRLEDGALVTRQGDPGDALYLMAGGEVRVSLQDGDTGATREVARLHEGTLFGEMALVTGQPRSASVTAVVRADVLEVNRRTLARVTEQLPVIREVLDRFTRERLIKNLLQTSPLFTPFTAAQQSELLRRFEGHDVEPGTEVLRQGEAPVGLFVVLSGALEVLARADDGAAVPLGKLATGDIFGEMSLLTNQPTSATVRASTHTTLLFLARSYVERLAVAIPEVRAYFESVAVQRARDNTLRLAGRALPSGEIEIDPSHAILI
jgi:CRP-like cAMP-binding protein